MYVQTDAHRVCALHQSTHRVRHNHIHLPDGTVCILCIPQCGRVRVGGAHQALYIDIASHSDFSQWFHFKHRAVFRDVSIVNGFIVPHLPQSGPEWSPVTYVSGMSGCRLTGTTLCLYKAVCVCVRVTVCVYIHTLTNPSAPAVINSPSSRNMTSTTPCLQGRGHGT